MIINDTPLKILSSSDCAECLFQNKITLKCEEKKKNKCNCQKPELLHQYKNNDMIGFCKNCGHFIIKMGNLWFHYNRPYTCFCPPFHQIECKACIANDHLKILKTYADSDKKSV